MCRLAMIILWRSFLMAIIAEGLLFSMVDPQDMHFFGGPMEMPSLAVYTIGFFCLWLFCALTSGLTCYLSGMPEQH